MSRIPFTTEKLKCPNTSERYQSHFDGLLTAHGPLTEDPNEKWDQFKELLMESAKTIF